MVVIILLIILKIYMGIILSKNEGLTNNFYYEPTSESKDSPERINAIKKQLRPHERFKKLINVFRKIVNNPFMPEKPTVPMAFYLMPKQSNVRTTSFLVTKESNLQNNYLHFNSIISDHWKQKKSFFMKKKSNLPNNYLTLNSIITDHWKQKSFFMKKKSNLPNNYLTLNSIIPDHCKPKETTVTTTSFFMKNKSNLRNDYFNFNISDHWYKPKPTIPTAGSFIPKKLISTRKNVIVFAAAKETRIRTGYDRNSFISYSCNVSLRIFFIKPVRMRGALTDKQIQNFQGEFNTILQKCFTASMLTLNPGANAMGPEIGAFYFNPEDPFFSVLFLFKKGNAPKTAEIKFLFPFAYNKLCSTDDVFNPWYPILFNINTYNIVDAMGIWDQAHSLEGPIILLSASDCINLFSELNYLRKDQETATEVKKEKRSARTPMKTLAPSTNTKAPVPPVQVDTSSSLPEPESDVINPDQESS